MKPCTHCGKPTEDYINYCNWDCIVNCAKAAGGTVHTPNGLPIRSVKFDNSMWEHEHGDHPDYKFPVVIEYVGAIGPADQEDYRMCSGEDGTEEQIRSFRGETHALIYSDGHVAVTLYECTYAMWSLADGMIRAGQMWKKGEYRLNVMSVTQIKEMKR